MNFLLDTQVAIWWLFGAPRLSENARALIAGSRCALSVASLWEVDLKHGKGKLAIGPREFRDEMRSAGAEILPVTDEHVLAEIALEPPHKDPFDRLLVGVADVERMTLLTADRALIALADAKPRLPIRGV